MALEADSRFDIEAWRAQQAQERAAEMEQRRLVDEANRRLFETERAVDWIFTLREARRRMRETGEVDPRLMARIRFRHAMAKADRLGVSRGAVAELEKASGAIRAMMQVKTRRG